MVLVQICISIVVVHLVFIISLHFLTMKEENSLWFCCCHNIFTTAELSDYQLLIDQNKLIKYYIKTHHNFFFEKKVLSTLLIKNLENQTQKKIEYLVE